MTVDSLQCPACTGTRTNLYAVKNGHKLYRCGVCASIFVHPFPAAPETTYTQDYFCGGGACGGYTDYDRDKKAMRESFLRIVERLEHYNGGRAGYLLDVGTATGVFIEYAREREWDVSGTEISPYAVSAAKQKGLNVIPGDATAVAASPGMYDVVTFWDVIEHLINPRENLRAAYSLLKPHGILALITPDTSSFWAKLVGRKWHLLNPPEHLVCYSKKGIVSMLDAEGFSMLCIGKPDKRFSIPYIFHIAANRFGIGFLDVLSRFFDQPLFRRFSIPLNFRDNMFIIARKR